MNIVDHARKFAENVHRRQVRKYTGEKYFVHLDEVAKLCERFGLPKRAVAAAYLHDTIEDQPVTYEDIREKFGREIADLVKALTDEPAPNPLLGVRGPNREQRKKLDRERLALAPADAQSIKCADLISNTSSIVRHDPHFAVTYLAEKRAVLMVLTRANPRLLEMAWDSLKQAERDLDP